jgi:hypothetical protein
VDQDFQISVPGFSPPQNIIENFALTDISPDGPSGFLLSGAYVSTLTGPSDDFSSVVLQFAISEPLEGAVDIATDNLLWTSDWDSQGCLISDSVRISSQNQDIDASILASAYCPLDTQGIIASLSPTGELISSINLEPTEDNLALQKVNQIVPTNNGNLLFLRGSRPSSGWLAILDAAFDTPDDNWTSATISRLLLQGPGPSPEPLTVIGPMGVQANVGTEINTSILVTGGTGTYLFALLEGSVLPPGLTFSSQGIISGTPTVVGFTTISFTVSDDSNRVSWDFEFEIIPASSSVSLPPVAPPAPTPIPYLRTLTTPKKNLRDGKLICTPGTYNAGYTLDGVIQGSTTSLFTPTTFTYNLIINGIAQISLAVTSSSPSNSWDMPSTTSGTLITCSVTVSANGLTNTDRSSDNAAGISAASVTQSNALATANSDYSASLNANSKAYQKTLADNRTAWRSSVANNRATYLSELSRINASPQSKETRAKKSAALKIYMSAQKQIVADYKASQPAALTAKETADKAALDTRNAAIAKANATYATFIESIGYGVLIP